MLMFKFNQIQFKYKNKTNSFQIKYQTEEFLYPNQIKLIHVLKNSNFYQIKLFDLFI